MVILKETMTIGPKGQVVIPAPFRRLLDISPGMSVMVELEERRVVIEKPTTDVIKKFRAVAKKVNYKGSFDADKDYDAMMEERWKRLLT